MKLLLSYLKDHKGVVLLALVLAGMNIGFSLMDPYITGHIMDDFIEKRDVLSHHDFVWGVIKLVSAAIGVAMVSRIAKNFQDYFTSIIVQKTGAKMYADGLKTLLNFLTRYLKTSAAAKHWASCKRCVSIPKNSSLRLSAYCSLALSGCCLSYSIR
jgi:ABC-type multidrug transport system fused ATPase/permease subunit